MDAAAEIRGLRYCKSVYIHLMCSSTQQHQMTGAWSKQLQAEHVLVPCRRAVGMELCTLESLCCDATQMCSPDSLFKACPSERIHLDITAMQQHHRLQAKHLAGRH